MKTSIIGLILLFCLFISSCAYEDTKQMQIDELSQRVKVLEDALLEEIESRAEVDRGIYDCINQHTEIMGKQSQTIGNILEILKYQ